MEEHLESIINKENFEDIKKQLGLHVGKSVNLLDSKKFGELTIKTKTLEEVVEDHRGLTRHRGRA